jgi:hypothetical protein
MSASMNEQTTQPIQIFRAGTHTDMSGRSLVFTGDDLTAMAEGYDPKRHEAPLVTGHPKHDDPAYGWVSSLQVVNGILEATPRQVDSRFAELVRAGRFKKISATFYSPGTPNNPVPGSYYLRHVGFLGAQPPAVKGLKSVEFADAEDGMVTVAFADYPAPDIKSTQIEDSTMSEKEEALNRLQKKLDDQEAAITQRETRFRTLERHLSNGMADILERAASKMPPLCLIVAAQAKPGPLRPNGHCDWVHNLTLYTGCRPGRTGPQAADLLVGINQILSGLVPVEGQTSEISPGPERLVASQPHLILWSQEFSFTRYQ